MIIGNMRWRLCLIRVVCARLAMSLLPLPALTGVALAQSDSSRVLVPTVQTAATAQRNVRPDVAILTLSFSALGRTPAAAGEALASRADGIRRALQGLGIPRDSLLSGSRWYWWRGRVELVVETHSVGKGSDGHGIRETVVVHDTSYRATDAIEVHVHDLKRVGAAIDSALAHGITDISPIRFVATDVTAAREDALREATASVRRQAVAIAEASGGRLGRTLSLTSDREDEAPYARFGLETAGLSASAQPGTEVIAPSVTVSVTVHGKWELLGRP
jgi:uncharacterized protein YggE